jgi:hypothetical protein
MFNRKKVDVVTISAIDKDKCEKKLASWNYKTEDFFEKSDFSDKEKGKILLTLLLDGVSPKSIFEFLEWKDFEIIISALFDEMGYSVLSNFRFKDEFTRYEIDVIAFNFPYLFLIDCKYYRHPSPSMMRDAASKQIERTEVIYEMFPVLSEELIKKLTLPLKRELKLYPLIISWKDHNIQFASDIPIIPFNQLSGFLQEIDELREGLFNIPLFLK